MQKQWKLNPADQSTVREVVRQTKLPEPIVRILVQRNFCDKETIEAFLEPRLANLSDPLLLPDMEQAVHRIWKAIDANEGIVVFGDYDVDGVTSTALLTRVLQQLNADVAAFIPDRSDEGYGLSEEALERCLKLHDSSLIITVDCGVNSVDSIAKAQANGIDVIVTDHHEPAAQTAPAFALINPKLGTKTSLFSLSGVGVAFKLAHAIVKDGREQNNGAADQVDLREYLDYVALGTVTDLVPLLAENRILVRHGLTAIDQTPWEGMRALKQVAGIRGEAECQHVGFQLGPRINAAGRIGQPMQALRLLTTDDPAEAREIAELLDGTNKERRQLEQEMANEAFEEIDMYYDPDQHYGLVVAREGWHPGVVGIVAARVARHYNRPSIVMGFDESTGNICGSCRSINEFDLLEGLRECESLLVRFGGHKMAAGLELPAASLGDFKIAFNLAVSAELSTRDLSHVMRIDTELTSSQINWDFYNQLKKLSPFGQDNPEPIFMLAGAEVCSKPRVVGDKHLKLTLQADGLRHEAIAFNFPLSELPDGKLDVAFSLKRNEWSGKSSLQLQIKDFRVSCIQ